MIESNSLLDPNILVYAYDIDEREKHAIASNLLQKVFEDKMNISLSVQNLSELYVSITKKIKRRLSFDDAEEIVWELSHMPNIKIFSIGDSSVISATNICSEFGISYWDALIAAVMRENKIYTIITENEKDFRKIPWIKVVNPFKKRS